ncbi:hypothetical protein KJ951_01080, partial [Patescibacteria group bacterium]|nr:hypothetical protein [Patescibacteria group bacterium]MBU1702973.1 hypothetical protein [Patescibacteria group bacterium]
KVEIEYLAQTREQTKEENAADMAKINELLKDHKYQETIRIAQKLRVLKFNESKVKQLIRKIKYEWINYELQQCKTLLDSDKYEDILLTLQRIKKIDPNSAKLAKLLVNTNKKYKRFKIMEKRDFIYQGLEKTVTLMQLKKYEKAMIASREILDIDADNKKANYLHILSKRKFAKSIDTELIAQMKKGHLKNREDFNKDNSSFIKI